MADCFLRKHLSKDAQFIYVGAAPIFAISPTSEYIKIYLRRDDAKFVLYMREMTGVKSSKILFSTQSKEGNQEIKAAGLLEAKALLAGLNADDYVGMDVWKKKKVELLKRALDKVISGGGEIIGVRNLLTDQPPQADEDLYELDRETFK